MSSKKILISTLLFPPDQVSTSYLYGDIAKSLIDFGWKVEIFTTIPHYNSELNFKKLFKNRILWYESSFYQARVYHVNQEKSPSVFIRSIYLFWFHFVYFIKGLFGKKYDIIITPSPLLTLGFISCIIAKIRGSLSIYNVQEIYPDLLIKHGKIDNSLIIRILKLIEHLTYKWSEKVVVIDEHFAQLIEDRLDITKIEIIPNFVDLDLYKKKESTPDILKKFGNKFIIGYVGNLGELQDWNIVFNTANELSSFNDIQFVLIGGGSEFDKLKDRSKNIENIEVFEYQNRLTIPSILSRINLHMICMNNSSDLTGLPSKVYSILAIGKPIIASTSSNSPLAKLIFKSKNGKITPLLDSKKMSDLVLKFYNNEFNDLSESYSITFIQDNYSRKAVMDKYQLMLSRL